jgi:hypothetical protein
MGRYAVKDSATFKGQRELLEKTVPRLGEALRGMQWALERKPYIFDKIESVSGLRLVKLEALSAPGSPETYTGRVYFKLLDDKSVELQWLEVAKVV